MTRVVALGLASGVLFGATMGFLNDNVWVGVVGGVYFGVFMAVVMRRSWEARPLKGLDRSQRRHVARTMRRGEAMDDAKLARPLVESANALLATPFPVVLMRAVFVLMFVLGAAVVVLDVVDGEVPAVSGVLLMLFSLVFLFAVVPMGIRQRERADRSKRATQSRWGDNPTGSV
ncbi:hypothetical protein [Kibdelosporangium phytohabitans]|nr:hypothetical protein [Kibdelosporangium phytohabitans]MBE1462988.1 hypothetical protein [Kibdelosporangium phytohabitans]